MVGADDGHPRRLPVARWTDVLEARRRPWAYEWGGDDGARVQLPWASSTGRCFVLYVLAPSLLLFWKTPPASVPLGSRAE